MLAIERVPAARYIKFMSVTRGSSPGERSSRKI